MSSLLCRRPLAFLAKAWQQGPASKNSFSNAPGNKRVQLGGIYPPLTTPFQADESIAYDQLAANLDRYARIPFAGLVVLGSNGEYPFMERDEKLQVVKFVRDNVKDKPVIAGSGCECKPRLPLNPHRKSHIVPNISFETISYAGYHQTDGRYGPPGR